MGLVDDLGGDGAQERPLERAVTARPEDDQVGTEHIRGLDDHRCRSPDADPGDHVDPGTPERLDRILEVGGTLGGDPLPQLVHVHGAGVDPAPALQRRIGREDGQDLDLRSVGPRQGGRGVDRERQFGRTIDGDQDFHGVTSVDP